jgi:probable DNA metabolism protein
MKRENQRTVYVTDGTREGFLTAVFDAYKDETAYLTSSCCFQQSLLDEIRRVQTDGEKAKRVAKKLFALSQRGASEVLAILRTPAEDREQTAFLYAKRIVAYGNGARSRLTDPIVRRALDLSGQVFTEVHRLKGFLRFRETEQGVYYAPCEPDNDVVDLLLPHFRSRLAGVPFVIHDFRRGVAVVYDGENSALSSVGQAEIALSASEAECSELWKKYYQTVNIESRRKEKQQKNYMPVRYWRTMVEEPWR